MDLVAGKISRLFDPHRSRDDVKPQEQRCDVGGPSEQFARRLLEHGIVVAPGSFFGAAGEGYARFALVPTQAQCERAAEILRGAL